MDSKFLPISLLCTSTRVHAKAVSLWINVCKLSFLSHSIIMAASKSKVWQNKTKCTICETKLSLEIVAHPRKILPVGPGDHKPSWPRGPMLGITLELQWWEARVLSTVPARQLWIFLCNWLVCCITRIYFMPLKVYAFRVTAVCEFTMLLNWCRLLKLQTFPALTRPLQTSELHIHSVYTKHLISHKK